MPTQSIELTEESAAILARHVESGEFADAQEAINTAIHALESREYKLARLREKIAEAERDIAEGRYTEYSGIEEFEEDSERLLQELIGRRSKS
jgi:Arc/MetJ-type ribon-helix-helix transcriptional regulator